MGYAGYIYPKLMFENKIPPLEYLFFSFGEDEIIFDNVNVLEVYHKIYKNSNHYRLFLFKLTDFLDSMITYNCSNCIQYVLKNTSKTLTDSQVSFIMLESSSQQLKDSIIYEWKYSIPSDSIFEVLYKNRFLEYHKYFTISPHIVFLILLYGNNDEIYHLRNIYNIHLSFHEKHLLYSVATIKKLNFIEQIYGGPDFFNEIDGLVEPLLLWKFYKYLYDTFDIELEKYFSLHDLTYDLIRNNDLDGLKFLFMEYEWEDETLDYNYHLELIDSSTNKDVKEFFLSLMYMHE
jgi:hypothetical protein